MHDAAHRQSPPAGKICLDHVAHFVPHIDAASAGLTAMGFTLTPFSPQSHRLEPGGPVVPAGTGNRCIMLNEGYLEILTPTADTPVANQLRTAIKRYVGVHLIAFGTSTPALDRERLSQAGFAPLSPVALQREIETPDARDTARFTVVRVPPGAMAEGRIQYCQHHTPHLLWQPRWLEHANGAQALTGALICVEDPQQAAQRYARFTGLLPHFSGGLWRLDTTRGCLAFMDAGGCRRTFDLEPPVLPWLAGYSLACENLAATRAYLTTNGITQRKLGEDRCFVELPSSVGGLLVLEPARAAPLAFV